MSEGEREREREKERVSESDKKETVLIHLEEKPWVHAVDEDFSPNVD